MNTQQIICQRCGQANTAEDRFCSNCGAPLQQPQSIQQPPYVQPQPQYPPPQPAYAQPPPRRSGGNTWLIVGGIGLLLLLGLCCAVAVVGWLYGDQLLIMLQQWM